MSESGSAFVEQGRVSNPCWAKRHQSCQSPLCTCDCHAPPAKRGHHVPEIALEWEEPPKRDRKRSTVAKLQPLVLELKRNPGKWARLIRYKSPISASTCAQNFRKHYPDIEFTARRHDNGSDLYGRFMEEE
jgi:hypothetical protein